MKLEKIDKQQLAEAISYRSLKSDDALFIHKNGGFSVKSNAKVSAYKYQGFTLCLDNLSVFLGKTETSDDGNIEAEQIANWMLNQN